MSILEVRKLTHTDKLNCWHKSILSISDHGRKLHPGMGLFMKEGESGAW